MAGACAARTIPNYHHGAQFVKYREPRVVVVVVVVVVAVVSIVDGHHFKAMDSNYTILLERAIQYDSGGTILRANGFDFVEEHCATVFFILLP